jgi:hypothetical protein
MKTGANALVLGVALLLTAGCSGGKSFAVVKVRSATGDFPSIAQFLVFVTNEPSRRDTLYYPRSPAGPYRVSTSDTVDFSVSFSSSYLGALKIGVAPRDAQGTSLGYGETEKTIEPGEVMQLEVLVTLNALPPPTGDDAGAPTSCEPTNPAACGVGNTCFVRCEATQSAGACTAAGTGQPGRACTNNRDCAPGSQCFEFACGKICMKFCKADAECGEGRCSTSVPCGNTATSHRVCSQPCDPRGEGTTGCESGLRCFLFDGENAACDCPGANRGDGEACQGVRDCRPGFVCVEMEGAIRVCRPLCKLADMGPCAAGRTCTQLVMPDYKVYGACLPPP